jgi:hypothetical protein
MLFHIVIYFYLLKMADGIHYQEDDYSLNDGQSDFVAMRNKVLIRMYELYIRQYH